MFAESRGGDVTELRPTATIRVSADGTWQPDEGGFEALLLPVCALGGALIDVVAWESCRPKIWWLRRHVATFIGEHEAFVSQLYRRPVMVVETPASYLKLHGYAFCILDWRANAHALLSQYENGVVYETDALAERVRQSAHSSLDAQLKMMATA